MIKYVKLNHDFELLKDPELSQRDVEVIAFVRFHNESITFKESLESLLPTVKKGILAYHNSIDNSLPYDQQDKAENSQDLQQCIAIAQEFVKKNPGFKIAHYPYPVFGANHPVYDKVYYENLEKGVNVKEEGINWEKTTVISEKNALHSFYKFTLDECKKIASSDDVMILKVDGDHIYDSVMLQKHIDEINSSVMPLDILYLSKYNCYYDYKDKKIYFCNIVSNHDHFFVNSNKCDFIFKCIPNPESNHIWSWETMVFKGANCPSFKVKTADEKCFKSKLERLRFKLLRKGLKLYNKRNRKVKHFIGKLLLKCVNHNHQSFPNTVITNNFNSSHRYFNSVHFLYQKHLVNGYLSGSRPEPRYSQEEIAQNNYIELTKLKKDSYLQELNYHNNFFDEKYIFANNDKLLKICKNFYQYSDLPNTENTQEYN